VADMTSPPVTPIPERELLAYQADVKGAIFRQIRQIFSQLKQSGFTQKDLAIKIGMNEGQLSRRLRGDYDLRLETLSDLARGLECRIDVKLTPIRSVQLLAVGRGDADIIKKHVSVGAVSSWEKSSEFTRGEVSKEWRDKEASRFEEGLAKPSDFKGRFCAIDRRRLSDKRWLGQTRVSPRRSKRSLERAGSYASWKR
jgi:transcriptional regulator with XRE-family HTH domain